MSKFRRSFVELVKVSYTLGRNRSSHRRQRRRQPFWQRCRKPSRQHHQHSAALWLSLLESLPTSLPKRLPTLPPIKHPICFCLAAFGPELFALVGFMFGPTRSIAWPHAAKCWALGPKLEPEDPTFAPGPVLHLVGHFFNAPLGPYLATVEIWAPWP